jgi:hypothetical protein
MKLSSLFPFGEGVEGIVTQKPEDNFALLCIREP